MVRAADKTSHTHECLDATLSRRRLIGAGSLAAAWAMMPKTAVSLSSRDPRFLCVVLRGALDGLAAVPPVGDPNYERLRQAFSLQGDAIIMLDGFFALNRHLRNLANLYMAHEALIIHAVATPYRDRSHFDGQDVLETGLGGPGGHDGWLNRAVHRMPSAGQVMPLQGLSIGPTAPLIMRGPAKTLSWQESRFPEANEDTSARVLKLYQALDDDLSVAMEAALDLDETASNGTGNPQSSLFNREMAAAARFLANPEGPRIAAISSDGWDTHARENPTSGRLARLLGQLDEGIATLKVGLGPVWRDTVVAFVTEFGRTAAINGTGGTDHGNGTIAILVGGAVNGGRIITDWPGLRSTDLLDQRDLKPTIDLRSVLKGVLRDQFEMPAEILKGVFPTGGALPGLRDLIA